MISLQHVQKIVISDCPNLYSLEFIGFVDAPLLRILFMIQVRIVSLSPLKKLYSTKIQ